MPVSVRRWSAAALLAALLTLTTGCGQKGPLYMPDQESRTQPGEAADKERN